MSGILDVPGPDGRTIEVLTAGAPDGFPLLFHNGTPTAVAPWDYLDETSGRLGLRLITYSRPGYGGSLPRPAAGRYVDDVVDSVAVLDQVGVDDFVTWGWSGGGPRALACAALLPQRCRAAATLAGLAPWNAEGLDWLAGMGQENVDDFTVAHEQPEDYEKYVIEHTLPVLAATADQIVEAMGTLLTPVDAAVLTADYADWLSRTFDAAGAQGAVGTTHDSIAAVSPWGFDLSDIGVPVAIWQGGQDAMVPFAHGQWLAAHVPGARGYLFEDEGHLSLATRLNDILTDLKQLAGL